jgi:hypothetical protein
LAPPARILLFWLPSLALIASAWLAAWGLALLRQRPAAGPAAPRPVVLAAGCLALSGLVLARTLHNLYWLTVWDLTYDPLGYLWIVLPVLAALGAGVLLARGFGGRARWAGLYGLLVPALVIVVSAGAQRVDFRQLTADRAARVSWAIGAYRLRHGQYPAALSDLPLLQRLSLAGPVIINGLDWCYQGGADAYQLAYVDRGHWSSPILTAQVVSSAGPPPEKPPCAAEIAAW